MKEKMGKAGYVQGDMSPHVSDYQKPMSDFSQSDFNRTDAYIERQDAYQRREASEIKGQGYKGRYS